MESFVFSKAVEGYLSRTSKAALSVIVCLVWITAGEYRYEHRPPSPLPHLPFFSEVLLFVSPGRFFLRERREKKSEARRRAENICRNIHVTRHRFRVLSRRPSFINSPRFSGLDFQAKLSKIPRSANPGHYVTRASPAHADRTYLLFEERWPPS